jgi:hypothetical protein
MSKKQSKKTKMAKKTASDAPAKTTKTRGSAKQPTAPVGEGGETEAAASRLPPAGTVIKKVDRHGDVRCQCTITDDGMVRYKGQNYRSLSGAAMAAARDLGLENKTQNGFTFWGLTKPTRTLDDPEAAVQKASDRFQKLAAVALKGASDQARPKVLAVLEAHENVVQGLLGEAAQ